MSFSLISQVYIVSTFVGSGFMIVSTLLGKVPRHGGAHAGGHGQIHGGGHGGGHGASNHGISHGGARAIGHSGGAGHGAAGGGHGGGLRAGGAHAGSAATGAGHGSAAGGHSGNAAHGGAGHGAAAGHGGAAHNASAGHSASSGHGANAGHSASGGHGGNAGQSDAIHSAAAHAANIAASAEVAMASTGPITTEPSGIITRALGKVHGLHVELKEENLLEAILGLFNPLSMATFMTFFGLAGVIVSVGLKLPEIVSVPVACLAGYVAVQMVVHVIAFLFENMGSSSEARVEDLIGRMAEVTVPIAAGKIGEITYIIKSKRYASPAKALDVTLELSKRAKVIISELQDHLMIVEPWTDSFIDPDFDAPKLH